MRCYSGHLFLRRHFGYRWCCQFRRLPIICIALFYVTRVPVATHYSLALTPVAQAWKDEAALVARTRARTQH